MAAYGAVAYPLLESLRNERTAIEDVLTAYTSNGSAFAIDSLPPALAFYHTKSTSATIDLLHQRYVAIQDLEFKMALLDTTRAATSQYADRIRVVMDQAEKVMASCYAGEPVMAIPWCLVDCYRRGSSQATIAAIRERYIKLRDQEVRLAMFDLKLVAPGTQDNSSATARSEQDYSASAPIDASDDKPPGYK
ncbi:hypothetical protein BGZ92_004788 [Podila epicladia]|nr:hypothetical protein BGZ92_004788 [Podila epicladia]